MTTYIKFLAPDAKDFAAHVFDYLIENGVTKEHAKELIMLLHQYAFGDQQKLSEEMAEENGNDESTISAGQQGTFGPLKNYPTAKPEQKPEWHEAYLEKFNNCENSEVFVRHENYAAPTKVEIRIIAKMIAAAMREGLV